MTEFKVFSFLGSWWNGNRSKGGVFYELSANHGFQYPWFCPDFTVGVLWFECGSTPSKFILVFNPIVKHWEGRTSFDQCVKRWSRWEVTKIGWGCQCSVLRRADPSWLNLGDSVRRETRGDTHAHSLPLTTWCPGCSASRLYPVRRPLPDMGAQPGPELWAITSLFFKMHPLYDIVISNRDETKMGAYQDMDMDSMIINVLCKKRLFIRAF